MGKLILGLILLVIGIIGYFVCWRRMKKESEKGRMIDEELLKTFGWGKHLSSAALVVALLLIIFSVLRIIPAGHVGVPVLFGQVKMVILKEGLHVVNPLYNVAKMDARVQKHQAKYEAASKDLQDVNVEMVLNYRILSEKAPEIFKNVGLGYEEIIIVPAAQEVLKANTALFNAGEILVRRAEIKNDVHQGLAKWLIRYWIRLEEISLANITFDPEYEKAIVTKQVEEQRAEQKKYLLIQAQKDAEILVVQAKAKGDAARQESLGVAEALKIRGEAEANYNQKVSASLSRILIEKMYYDTWDGALPVYLMGGAGAIPLFQIPAPTKSEGK